MRAAAAPLLIAVAALVGGCGFRLQGGTPMPEAVAVLRLDTADERTPLAAALQRRFAPAGARLSTDAAAGAAVLRIERDELLERVASVSARNIPREYELTQVVRFSLEVGGARRISSAEVSVSRNLRFDERRALAKQREREQLRATLADEAAGIVLQRVRGLR